MLCLNCQKETINPKFCSRSCSASYTNKTNPKRQLSKKCCKCDTLITYNRKYCKNCTTYGRPRGDLTIKDAVYKKHHRSSAFALIRLRARLVAKQAGLNTCQHCGYSKHVEVAHIKSISSFDDNTLVSIVNDLSNLIVLCPNCHWEFDHQS